MRVLDLFAGTGSATEAFRAAGASVLRVEMDPRHDAELHADIMTLRAVDLFDAAGGLFDFIWASPPCQAFSIASIGKYWQSGGANPVPKHPKACEAERLVRHTLALIRVLAPRYWLLENPRGMLRKLPPMRSLWRWTVTYCQYGDERMKPTDLWGVMPDGWAPRPMCNPRASCHAAAPRGSHTGTQGRGNAVDRSRVPLLLSADIAGAVYAARGRAT